jgi:hypothetical protein
VDLILLKMHHQKGIRKKKRKEYGYSSLRKKGKQSKSKRALGISFLKLAI